MSNVTAVPIPPVKRSYLAWLWLGVAAAVVGGAALALQAPVDPATAFLARNAHNPGVVQTASGLEYQVLKPGTGSATPTDDDVALINYEGTLTDGTTFDKSPQPTPMPVKGVVPGFSEAMKMMPKGAKYRFWIPPAMAYGDKDQKDQTGKIVIPAHSVLVFTVDMIDWKSEAEIQMMQQMMQQQQGAGAVPGGR